MNINEIPLYYADLSQDELKLLLYVNQIKFNDSKTQESREYYQKKIDYIKSLIKG